MRAATIGSALALVAGTLVSTVAAAEVRPAAVSMNYAPAATAQASLSKVIRGRTKAEDSSSLALPFLLPALLGIIVVTTVVVVATDDNGSSSPR